MTNLESVTEKKRSKTPSGVASEPPCEPKVHEYQNYRSYLSDWYRWKKEENPRYSGTLFSQKAGLKSHTLLSLVTQGKRNLSADTIRAFSRALHLGPRDSLFFEKLVLFNQAKNGDDKAFYLNQLVSISKGGQRSVLTKLSQYFKLIQHWYVVAIQQLVRVEGFQKDPAWIARQLKGKISAKQADEALKLLEEFDFIRWDPARKAYEVHHPAIDLQAEGIDLAIRNYQREHLQRAIESIDEESPTERELSSFTVAIPKDDLPWLREKIKAFRLELNRELPRAKAARTHVVAVNVQMLLLSESDSPPRKAR